MNTTKLWDVAEPLARIRTCERQIRSALRGTQYQARFESCLNAVAGELDRGKFVLAFVGDWNSGKSSLINRLLFGVDWTSPVLPVSDKPCTSRITTIIHAKEPVLYRVPSGSMNKTEIAKGADAVKQTLRELGSAAGQVEGAAEEDYELLLGWNNEILESGLIVVDTPGLEDPDRLRSLITETYIRSVHGVVVVSDAHKPVTEHLIRFLRNNVFRGQMHKFFFLMNKIDSIRAGSEPAPERVAYLREMVDKEIVKALDDFRRQLGEGLPRQAMRLEANRYFAVSAKTGDGIEAFTKELRHFAWTEAHKALCSAACGRLRSVINNLRDEIRQEESAIKDKKEDWLKKIRDLESQKGIVQDQINQRLDAFKEEWDRLEKLGVDKVREVFGAAVAEAEKEKEEKTGTFKSRIWPPSLAKELKRFCDDQQRFLERTLDDIDHEMRRAFQQASEKLIIDLQKAVFSLDPRRVAAAPPMKPEDGSVDLSAEGYAALAAAAAGAVGGGLAVATGATTAAWASGMPSVIVSALQGLGISTFNAGALVAWIAWPTAVVMLGAQAYILWRCRRKIVEQFDDYIKGLRQVERAIIAKIRESLTQVYPEIIKAIEQGAQRTMEDITKQMESMRDAAEAGDVSADARRIKGELASWENELAHIEQEFGL